MLDAVSDGGSPSSDASAVPAPAVEIRGLKMQFPGVLALRGVSLKIPRGRVIALVGENGAGKSTLVSILAGLISGFDGDVLMDGKPVTLGSPARARQAGVGLVEQELSLIPELTVAENIMLGHRELHRMPGYFSRRVVNSRARALLKMIGVEVPLGLLARQLSPAQAQVAEIAKALAQRPRLFIMDEPTSSLASHEAAQVLDLVRRLRAEGTTVLYISHKLEEVMRVADAVVVLRDGEKVAEGPVDGWSEERLIQAMVGRDLSRFYHRASHTAGEIVLEARGLTIPGQFASVSFALRAGEIVGMAGLVGAGRTEIAEALYGLRQVREGSISISGKVVRIGSPSAAIAAGIALVPEDRRTTGFVPELTTLQNISLAALRKFRIGPFLAQSREKREVQAMASRVNLGARMVPRPIRTLSGGNKQKAIIAKCLLLSPKVLILDEPTRGIDVGAKSEIYNIIHQLTQAGMAALLISSEMPEILGISDRILVVREGEIVAEFDRASATEESLLAAASGGAAK